MKDNGGEESADKEEAERILLWQSRSKVYSS